MKLTPVKGSSAIKAQAYDPETRTLRVQTHAGKVYEYDSVPMERYAAFTGAASMGHYWNSRIKPNHEGKEVKD